MPLPAELQELLATPQLPELGPASRPGILKPNDITRRLEALLPQGLSREQRELVRALMLLWHDDLDGAHQLAQAVDDPDGAFVHGIMHRREPDYGNAAYWFRRVGQHPAFPEIARRAGQFLEGKGQKRLQQKLTPGGKWDPFAFVDACAEASGATESGAQAAVLRDVQKIEFEVLLEWLFGVERKS
jgi:hypothetical protein